MTGSFGWLRFHAGAMLMAAGALGIGGTSPALAGGSGKPVIELFTSQGCSSCPPADALIGELAASGTVIALSLPVDYWDRLGWKDTFAKPAFTSRQQAYSAARGDQQVYTPQAVINGQVHAVGSSRRGIAEAITATSASLTVAVKMVMIDGAVQVMLPQGSGRGMVVALPVIGSRPVAIGRGENANTKVLYTNIVRDVVPLGEWTGAAQTLTIPAAALAGAESVVVVVQQGSAARPGPITGSAELALKPVS